MSDMVTRGRDGGRPSGLRAIALTIAAFLTTAGCSPPTSHKVQHPVTYGEIFVSDTMMNYEICVQNSTTTLKEIYQNKKLEGGAELKLRSGFVVRVKAENEKSTEYNSAHPSLTEAGLAAIRAECRAFSEGISNDSANRAERRGAQSLIIGGAILLGVSLAGMFPVAIGVQTVRFAEKDYAAASTREEQLAANRLGNKGQSLAIAGGVGSAVVFSAGLPLLIVGIGRLKASKRNISLSPAVSERFSGLILKGRF